MEIMQVEAPLIVTNRVAGLKHIGLRVLRKGARQSEVPLRSSVVAALGRHRADRNILESSGVVASIQRPCRQPLL